MSLCFYLSYVFDVDSDDDGDGESDMRFENDMIHNITYKKFSECTKQN